MMKLSSVGSLKDLAALASASVGMLSAGSALAAPSIDIQDHTPNEPVVTFSEYVEHDAFTAPNYANFGGYTGFVYPSDPGVGSGFAWISAPGNPSQIVDVVYLEWSSSEDGNFSLDVFGEFGSGAEVSSFPPPFPGHTLYTATGGPLLITQVDPLVPPGFSAGEGRSGPLTVPFTFTITSPISTVPDAGASFALLGLGLAGLIKFRRFKDV